MHLFYYWRGDNYRRDLDHGLGFHLNQGNPLLHEIVLGESLWAFTRNLDDRYVLAAELVISAKTMNPSGFRYGPYRVWGDLRRSRYFQTQGQPDISTLVRDLGVAAKAAILGRAFQGHAAVRPIGNAQHLRLLAYAEALPLEPRARLLPRPRVAIETSLSSFVTYTKGSAKSAAGRRAANMRKSFVRLIMSVGSAAAATMLFRTSF
jgi:5-methylcytosine-specific restriction protein A